MLVEKWGYKWKCVVTYEPLKVHLHDMIVVCDCSSWVIKCCLKGIIPAFDSLS